MIEFNAQGVKNALRGKNDGFTYFGCKKKAKSDDGRHDGEILNDYIIENKDPETNDRHRGRHFQIEFDIEQMGYKIRDLGIGFGAFAKIDKPLILKDNNLISMGSSFLIINLEEDKESIVYANSQDNSKNAGDKEKNPATLINKDDAKAKKKSILSANQPELTIKIFGGPNYGEV